MATFFGALPISYNTIAARVLADKNLKSSHLATFLQASIIQLVEAYQFCYAKVQANVHKVAMVFGFEQCAKFATVFFYHRLAFVHQGGYFAPTEPCGI